MKKTIHIQYGFITGILLMVIMAVFYLAKINVNGNVQMLVVVSTIFAGVIYSCWSFRQQNRNATNNEVFFNGFRTTAIIALLLIAFGVLLINFLPGFKETQINNFRAGEIKAANGDAEKLKVVETTVTDYKNKFTTMFIGINMMIIVISGLISSAIGAILSKNKG